MAHFLLFGGHNHDEFLGCLTCNEFQSNSVCNEFGQYGSEFRINSIWNEFGPYGSEFRSTSPWNEFASNPPVIVDEKGNFYGYFTANQFKSDRTRIDAYVVFLNNIDHFADLNSMRDFFCGE